MQVNHVLQQCQGVLIINFRKCPIFEKTLHDKEDVYFIICSLVQYLERKAFLTKVDEGLRTEHTEGLSAYAVSHLSIFISLFQIAESYVHIYQCCEKHSIYLCDKQTVFQVMLSHCQSRTRTATNLHLNLNKVYFLPQLFHCRS